jgi:hypothetical protein
MNNNSSVLRAVCLTQASHLEGGLRVCQHREGDVALLHNLCWCVGSNSTSSDQLVTLQAAKTGCQRRSKATTAV